MRLIKVLQVSTERSWRGGEQQLAYLIKSALMLGIQIVVAVRSKSDFHKWCVENSIEHYPLSLSNGFDAKSALAIRNICRKENIDIVHAHSGKGLSIVYLSILFGLKTPVVVHRRVDFAIKSKGFSLAKYNHNHVKRIVCVSEAVSEIVKGSVQRPDRVITIHSGIDFSRFSDDSPTGYIHREFKIEPTYELVANVAAYAPHKDYFTFLDTAAIVLKSFKSVHFLAIGDGNMGNQLKDYAYKLGIAAHVTFTGFRNDVPHILRELDVFLITSSTEGLGTSIIDAMYNSLPVVATRAGGIPELVDSTNGFIENPGDKAALAAGVIKLLEDKQLAQLLGSVSHQKALKFSKDEMASQVVKVYREIIQEETRN